MTIFKKTFHTSFFLTSCAMPFTALAADLNVEEKAIIAYVEQHFDEQLSFLEKTVNINSGTLNLKGVRQVGAVYQKEFDALGFRSKWIGMPVEMKRAGHLHSEIKGRKGKRLLLIGHFDTVFPTTSDFQKFENKNGRITGPGVVDMKNGDAIILYALKALHANGLLEDRRISVLITGDEESTGLPLSISRKDLIGIAKKSDAAINFEAGRPDQAVIARRGSSSWTLEVSGKRAHSSGIFGENSGAGAIFETARILDGFYSQVRGERNLTFNPAIISGGTNVTYNEETRKWTSSGKGNVIPQTVTVKGDLRFITEEQKERVRNKMRQIVAVNLPKTSAKITFKNNYPPMPITQGNKDMLTVLDQVSFDLGYGHVKANDPGSRGAADISFVAPHIASIDGLGSWGGGSHTYNEWLDEEGFEKATKRAALYLYRLTRE